MAASAFLGMSSNQRLIAYVDGFNLYYRALRKPRLLWLNLEKLIRLYFPSHELQRVKYFTALVNSNLQDPEQHIRQQTYLRALATTPLVEVILGNFLTKSQTFPREQQWRNQLYVPTKVIRSEEKKSDVNLAAHLLVDGFKDRYDLAVVVSNDSDLEEPVRAVREELLKGVVVLNPAEHVNDSLKRQASKVKDIRVGALKESQFPRELEDARGTFYRPPAWDPGVEKPKREKQAGVSEEVSAYFSATDACCPLRRALDLYRGEVAATIHAIAASTRRGPQAQSVVEPTPPTASDE